MNRRDILFYIFAGVLVAIAGPGLDDWRFYVLIVGLVSLHDMYAPPPTMEVTKEMVDSIGEALYIYWNNVNEQAKDTYRKKVRAALTAALKGSERE